MRVLVVVCVVVLAGCSVGRMGGSGSPGAKRWGDRTGPTVVAEHCVERLDLDGYAEAFRVVRGPDWDGADMSVAADLGGDVRLWLYGDTFTGEIGPDDRILDPWDLLHNSMVVQRGKCFEFHMGVVDGVISEVIPDRSRRSRYWPGGAYAVRDGRRISEVRVLVTIGHKPKGADGSFSVRLVGAAMVRMSWPDLRVLAIEELGSPRKLILHHLVDGGDGWKYIYAHRRTASPAQFVARGRDEDLIRGRLRWWNGRGWTRDVSEAVPMEFIDGGREEEGPYSPLYVVADAPGFVASATRLVLMTTDVSAWWSRSPWGPWRTASDLEGRVVTMPMDSENYRYGGHVSDLPGLGPTAIWNHHPGYREGVNDAYVFGPRFAALEGFTTPWRSASGG